MAKLGYEFFHRPCLTVAEELVGKILVHKTAAGEVRLRITETEGYCGEQDTACHAHKGRTNRTEVLYADAGTVYVYLCYGIHNLMNLVTEATLMAGLLQLNNVGVAANTGSMGMAAEPLTALKQTGATLCHVHVENALTRRMPRDGDGEDYFALMRTLRQIGYAGGISVRSEARGEFAPNARAALLCLRQAQHS